MATIENTFETGASNATAITIANSDDNSAGAALNAEPVTTGGTVTFSTTSPKSGSLCAAITHSSTADAHMQWYQADTARTSTWRFYFRKTANNATAGLGIFTAGSAGTNEYIHIVMNNNGLLALYDFVGSPTSWTTGALKNDIWYRFELTADNTTEGSPSNSSYAQLNVYEGDSLDRIPNLCITAVGKNFGTNNYAKTYVGRAYGTSAAAGTWYYDDFAWEPATLSMLGPSATQYQLENTAETGLSGSYVTAANSDSGTAGDAFDLVTDNVAAAQNLTYSATAAKNGSLGYLLNHTAGDGYMRMDWNSLSSRSVAAGCWIQFQTMPAADARFITIRNTNTMCTLFTTATDNIRTSAGSSGRSDSESPAISAGTWYYMTLGCYTNTTTSTVNFRIYNADGSVFWDFGKSDFSLANSDPITQVQFGRVLTTGYFDDDVWMDDLKIAYQSNPLEFPVGGRPVPDLGICSTLGRPLDFDNGTLEPASVYSEGTTAPVASTDVSYSGGYSVKCNLPAGASNGRSLFEYNNAAGTDAEYFTNGDEVWFAYRIYVSDYTTYDSYNTFWYFSYDGTANNTGMFWRPAANTQNYTLAYNGSTAATASLGAIMLDQWDHWVWQIVFSSNNTVGKVNAWRNDTQVITDLYPSNGTWESAASDQMLRIGFNRNTAGTDLQTAYFDDIAVATTRAGVEYIAEEPAGGPTITYGRHITIGG